MELVTAAIICITIFGVVATLAVFVRQLLLSRDKNLNDKAQQLAIRQEAAELYRLRMQMTSKKRFSSYYHLLGSNKESIKYIDHKIEKILHDKEEVIYRYAQMILKESSTIIHDGEKYENRKADYDRIREKIESEIASYDVELAHLQQQRASLWTAQLSLQNYITNQERIRNASLDEIYHRHSSLLEKIYIRHNNNSEKFSKNSIDAGTKSFSMIVDKPMQLLLRYFKPSTGVSFDQASMENDERDEVYEAEKAINDSNFAKKPSIFNQDEKRDLDYSKLTI